MDRQNLLLKDTNWGWKELGKKAVRLSSINKWFIRIWELEKKIKSKIKYQIIKHLLRAQTDGTAKVCLKSNVLRKLWQYRFNYTSQFSQSVISILHMLWYLKADTFIYLREMGWVCLTRMFHRKKEGKYQTLPSQPESQHQRPSTRLLWSARTTVICQKWGESHEVFHWRDWYQSSRGAAAFPSHSAQSSRIYDALSSCGDLWNFGNSPNKITTSLQPNCKIRTKELRGLLKLNC